MRAADSYTVGAQPPDLATHIGASGIARNSLWLLFASFSPYLIAIFAVPVLLRGLGPARFGTLTLCWAALNYIAVLDFGVGRALTRFASGDHPECCRVSTRDMFMSALTLTLGFGLCAAVVLGTAAELLFDGPLSIGGPERSELCQLLALIALCAPFVIGTPMARSMLEARHRFRYISIVACMSGTINFLGPMVVVSRGGGLVPVMAVLVAGRLATWVMYLSASLTTFTAAPQGDRSGPRARRLLLGYGGWVTVSNLVSPIMSYADRFFVGALISSAAVAYYATPSEIVARALMVAGGFGVVLFPNFSMRAWDPDRLRHLYLRALKIAAIVMFAAAMGLIGAGPGILELWLGEPFARQAAPVLKILAFGTFVNGAAQVPYSMLHAAGRPDVTAKVHICELPVYLFAVYALTLRFGIEGTAAAWVGRVCIDAGVLVASASRIAGLTRSQWRLLVAEFAAGIAILGVCAYQHSPRVGATMAALLGAACVLAGWRWVLGPEDRLAMGNLLKRKKTRD